MTGRLTPDERVQPYVQAIRRQLNAAQVDFSTDMDVAGSDASYFFTVACVERPALELFVAVSWIGCDSTQVEITIDVRYVDDQEIEDGLGTIHLRACAPYIVAHTVAVAASYYREHGHI
jgi:hypothetical protein